MQQIDQLNDLLNSDLAGVPTTRPLLKGIVKLKVKAATIDKNKAQDGSVFNAQCVLVEPTTSTDGRAVSPGFVIFHSISLKPTEKYNPKENMARWREGVMGTTAGSFAPVEQYIDQEFMASVSPKLDEEFGDKTVITKFLKKG